MLKALKPFRYLALPVAAVALVTGFEWLAGDVGNTTASAADWHASGFGPSSYSEALARSAEQIALGKERVRNGDDQWLRQESLARAHLVRSHLTPTYDDLIAAGESLALAQSLAPAGAGPLLTEAVYAHRTHQLNRIEQALAGVDRWAVQLDSSMAVESASLKGDIAFYRGAPDIARRHYAEAAGHGENSGVHYRRAILAKSSGAFDDAIEHFIQSNLRPDTSTPFANANTALQIGAVEMARGDHQAATEWFAAANRQFPGFWLIEAHLAQAKAIDGDLQGAIADMREIAGRVPAAEVMDALAMLLRADGQADESRRWARAAGVIWEKRLSQLPEATYGHALEHELVFGSADRALDLARRNLAARPYGEARLLLASALLANGKTREALRELTLAKQSGWRSAPLFALRSRALEVSGRSKEARDARNEALALNPRIFDSETSLVWLSHG